MFVDTKETSFLHDLTNPSLEALSHVLRHRELWPAGFVWDFGGCKSCAMGLAGKLWGLCISHGVHASCETVAQVFRMPIKKSHGIFGGMDWVPDLCCHLVTPEMVADQIDKYLAERAA